MCTPHTADAIAFEEQGCCNSNNHVVCVDADQGSYCMAPPHISLSDKQPLTIEMCLPVEDGEGVHKRTPSAVGGNQGGVEQGDWCAQWRRTRVVMQLVHRDVDDAYWPRTVEIVQVSMRMQCTDACACMCNPFEWIAHDPHSAPCVCSGLLCLFKCM